MWSTRIPDKCWLDAIAVRFYRIGGKFSPHPVFLGGKCLQEIGYYQTKSHLVFLGGKCLQEIWDRELSDQRQSLASYFCHWPNEIDHNFIRPDLIRQCWWKYYEIAAIYYQIGYYYLTCKSWMENLIRPHLYYNNLRWESVRCQPWGWRIGRVTSLLQSPANRSASAS